MMSRIFFGAAALLLAGALAAAPAQAQQPVSISISVKNHRFEPAQISAPANVPILLRVKNIDATPMEFESVSYKFFDDFHQETNGVLVVR